MGQILDDILLFIGIFPMPRLNFDKYKKFEKTKEDKLKELNGQEIVVKDYHERCIRGTLKYLNSFSNFDTCLLQTDNGIRRLHIHDLKKIF